MKKNEVLPRFFCFQKETISNTYFLLDFKNKAIEYFYIIRNVETIGAKNEIYNFDNFKPYYYK